MKKLLVKKELKVRELVLLPGEYPIREICGYPTISPIEINRSTAGQSTVEFWIKNFPDSVELINEQ